MEGCSVKITDYILVEKPASKVTIEWKGMDDWYYLSPANTTLEHADEWVVGLKEIIDKKLKAKND